MIEIIEVDLGVLSYQVEVDVTDFEIEEQEDYYDCLNKEIELVDIFFVKNGESYKVTNEHIWEEVGNLNLMMYYTEQCAFI